MRNEETPAVQNEKSWWTVIGTLIVALVAMMLLSTLLQLLNTPMFLSIFIIIVVSNVGMRISINSLSNDEQHPSFWTALKQSW